MEKIKKIMPGFIVCFAIAMISKGIAVFLPSLGAATFAYSIVLMGASLDLMDIASVRINGVIFIIIQMTLTICVTYFIGRKLKFNKKFYLLMSAGNAVCGSSAIASTAPVINGNSKDKALSITMVNITGTILMFVLPILSGFLYNKEVIQSSTLTGGILQSVGQVIASAKFISDDVVEMATIFKIIRIIMIVAVVIVFSKFNTNENVTFSFIVFIVFLDR